MGLAVEKDVIFIIWLCKQQKEDTLLLIVSASVLYILTPLNRKTHKDFYLSAEARFC